MMGAALAAKGYPQLQQTFTLTAFQTGILALSLNYGAYMTEIFRAGIQSISDGQHEAAISLGMNRIADHPAGDLTPGSAHYYPGYWQPVHRHAEGFHPWFRLWVYGRSPSWPVAWRGKKASSWRCS